MLISATEFKSRCLELLDRINRTGEVVTITKRGKIVAELHAPYDSKVRFAGPGLAKNEMKILGDIIEPIGADWDSLK